METVRFPAAQNGSIEADFYPGAGHQAVMLCHGKVFDKETWSEQAKRLAEAGLDVLALNFRGYGESSGDLEPAERFSPSLALDVLGAVAYLRSERGFPHVHVMGASMGGFAAAQAAVQSDEASRIDRLALLSPVGVEKPASIKAEALLYVVSEDEAMAELVTQQHAAAPEPKELLLLPGDAHAQHIFKGEQGEPLLVRLIEFFQGP